MGLTKFPHGILATPNIGVNRLADLFNSGNIWFVDGTNGMTGNDGLAPDSSVDLISTAVGLASAGASIYVRPKPPATVSLVWYQDSIDIPVGKSNISIYGAGGQRDEMGGVNIKPTTAGVGDHLIDVAAAGLHLENLRLTLNGGTAAAGKSIIHSVCAYSGGWTKFPVGLDVVNCTFGDDASHPGVGDDPVAAIALGSASYSRIMGCTFYNCLGGIALHSVVMSPYNIQILNNIFSGGPDRRDCDLMISINSADSNGIIVSGNLFADGLPTHSGGGTLRFVYFPYVTAGTGIFSNNYFASATNLYSEGGSQAVIADNFFMPGNFYEGTTTTAPYGIVTNA